MLDLGVGTGRTAYTFAALTRSYVGIDFAPRMIELAREMVEEDERTAFEVGDARDLSRFHGRDLDLVLFSFNGIDNVDHDDRLKVLHEIRRVLAADGVFAFSCHSLASLPFAVDFRLSMLKGFRSGYAHVRRSVRTVIVNRGLDLEAALERGWLMIRDDSGLVQYYVAPREQLRQLDATGFDVDRVLDGAGHVVDPEQPGRDPHLFYICRPRS